MFVNSERDIIRYEMDRCTFEMCVNGLFNREAVAEASDLQGDLKLCDSIRRALETYTLIIFEDRPRCELTDDDGEYAFDTIRVSLPVWQLVEFAEFAFFEDGTDRTELVRAWCDGLYDKVARKQRAYYAERE